jgi:hypothetical protein
MRGKKSRITNYQIKKKGGEPKVYEKFVLLD